MNGLAVTAQDRPNIVFMLSDDQGWNGLSVAMHPAIADSKGDLFQTPNLERLAAQGMRFSAGYAPASVCSPTRISLQTGKSPAALHWTKAAPAEEGHKLTEPRLVKNISANETTIAELLRNAGYATAHYGKWHIGGGGPGEHGYDEHDGDTGNENAYKFVDPNPVDIFGMADRAAAFMEKNAKAKKPFFIQLSWNALHAAENANHATMAKYEKLAAAENAKRIKIAAITEDLDSGVGKVLEAIDRLGLAKNTYVIYMSDNGSGGGKKVLNGGKGGVWEGGIRVPLIVRGPGVKPNSWCDVRVVGYDFFPTFCEWAGIDATKLPEGTEGGSIAALLANEGRGEVKRPREELVFHFPHYQGDSPHTAILLGDLKLIHFYEDDRDLLFDLSKDIGERNDLANSGRDDVQRLRQRMDEYLKAIDAQLPTANANYDPNEPGKTRRGKKGGNEGEIKGRKKDDSPFPEVESQQTKVFLVNGSSGLRLVRQTVPISVPIKNSPVGFDNPEIQKHFKPFEKTLKFRWDEQNFFVESNGIPDHPMMIGIRAWQQQVPIPQRYVGDNAWRIPLHPVPAKQPMSARNNFLRGAIALAVNGVPIFNPLNNRGDDAYLFGELDEYGGHCGRADDYHYHIAPVHLEKTIGKGQPIAYALDGYPIYGYEEPDGSEVKGLDVLNGHKDKSGRYHYHATKTYPYLNGGFYGEVIERDGQVDPQPRAEGIRPALPPLRDAKITGFKETEPKTFQLTYDVRGQQGTVTYTLSDDGSAKFEFVDPNGRKKFETYTPKRRGPDNKDRPKGDSRPPAKGGQLPNTAAPNATSKSDSNTPQLKVSSGSVNDQGFISIDCTCDGAGESPAVQWEGAPKETKCFALSIWHTAPGQEKSYWLVYNIPANVNELKQNSKGIGIVGLNDKKRVEYDPMCSKGPGVKDYHVTVFALSAEVKLEANQVSRAALLKAIKETSLAKGTLDFKYERKK